MCFFRKKNVQPVIDENRFYLKVVSNGFYIEIFGYGDPKNQMSIGAGEDKHDHELTEDKFNAIKKVMLEHLDELVTIYKKQTQQYIQEHTMDTYAKNITLKVGATSIKVNAAIDEQEDRTAICNVIERLKHIME